MTSIQQGKDPVKFWEIMLTDSRSVELAEFALTLFHMVLNTAGNERDFSKVKIKKSRLRNRIGDAKLQKVIKVPIHSFDSVISLTKY
jgi:hypothetical protein